jgi:hypothetical protein
MKLAICILSLLLSLQFVLEARATPIAEVDAVVDASYASTGPNPGISVGDNFKLLVGVDNLSTEYAFASYKYSAVFSFGSQEIVFDTSDAISCGNGPGADYCGLGFSNCDFAVYCYETEINDSLKLASLNLLPGETVTLNVTLSIETIAYSLVDEPQRIYLVFVAALLLVGALRHDRGKDLVARIG